MNNSILAPAKKQIPIERKGIHKIATDVTKTIHNRIEEIMLGRVKTANERLCFFHLPTNDKKDKKDGKGKKGKKEKK